MRAPTVGSNTAIFALFFGVSAVDAVWTHNWVRALLWFGFGSIFLIADMRESRSQGLPGSEKAGGK
jgi:hypothetical protein